MIIKKKCTVAGVCKNMETNKTRMANCKYSWPFRLMMEVTNEVIGQWKWVMISQRLIKHTLIIVTMNRKVKEDSKEMSEKKPSDISTWIFMHPKIAFSRAFLWIFEWLFNGFFTRFSASFFADILPTLIWKTRKFDSYWEKVKMMLLVG